MGGGGGREIGEGKAEHLGFRTTSLEDQYVRLANCTSDTDVSSTGAPHFALPCPLHPLHIRLQIQL